MLASSALWTHLEVQLLVWSLASSQGREPQSPTLLSLSQLRRDLFSLSSLKAEMELQMPSMLSCFLAGREATVPGIDFTFPAAQGAFPPAHIQGRAALISYGGNRLQSESGAPEI